MASLIVGKFQTKPRLSQVHDTKFPTSFAFSSTDLAAKHATWHALSYYNRRKRAANKDRVHIAYMEAVCLRLAVLFHHTRGSLQFSSVAY